VGIENKSASIKWMSNSWNVLSVSLVLSALLMAIGLIINGYLRSEPRYQKIGDDILPYAVFDRKDGMVYYMNHDGSGSWYHRIRDVVSGKQLSYQIDVK